MAKKDKASKAPVAVTMVTIADLEKEFGIEGRKIRMKIRSLGLKAPATGVEGFGPKSKYEWASDSAELAQIREALQNPAPAKASTKAAAAEESDEDEDEDEE